MIKLSFRMYGFWLYKSFVFSLFSLSKQNHLSAEIAFFPTLRNFMFK